MRLTAAPPLFAIAAAVAPVTVAPPRADDPPAYSVPPDQAPFPLAPADIGSYAPG